MPPPLSYVKRGHHIFDKLITYCDGALLHAGADGGAGATCRRPWWGASRAALATPPGDDPDGGIGWVRPDVVRPGPGEAAGAPGRVAAHGPEPLEALAPERAPQIQDRPPDRGHARRGGQPVPPPDLRSDGSDLRAEHGRLALRDPTRDAAQRALQARRAEGHGGLHVPAREAPRRRGRGHGTPVLRDGGRSHEAVAARRARPAAARPTSPSPC